MFTCMFTVPKGADDIRMVYNGTSNGINGIFCDTRVALSAVSNNLRVIYKGTFVANRDVG